MFVVYKKDRIVWVEETDNDKTIDDSKNEVIASFDDPYDAVAEAVTIDYRGDARYDNSLDKISCDMPELESPNRYGNVYVSLCVDDGIERTNPETGEDEICSGYYCQVYSDPFMNNELDYFCIAIGHELADDTSESIENAIKDNLGISDSGPALGITMS